MMIILGWSSTKSDNGPPKVTNSQTNLGNAMVLRDMVSPTLPLMWWYTYIIPEWIISRKMTFSKDLVVSPILDTFRIQGILLFLLFLDTFGLMLVQVPFKPSWALLQVRIEAWEVYPWKFDPPDDPPWPSHHKFKMYEISYIFTVSTPKAQSSASFWGGAPQLLLASPPSPSHNPLFLPWPANFSILHKSKNWSQVVSWHIWHGLKG